MPLRTPAFPRFFKLAAAGRPAKTAGRGATRAKFAEPFDHDIFAQEVAAVFV